MSNVAFETIRYLLVTFGLIAFLVVVGILNSKQWVECRATSSLLTCIPVVTSQISTEE